MSGQKFSFYINSNSTMKYSIPYSLGGMEKSLTWFKRKMTAFTNLHGYFLCHTFRGILFIKTSDLQFIVAWQNSMSKQLALPFCKKSQNILDYGLVKVVSWLPVGQKRKCEHPKYL